MNAEHIIHAIGMLNDEVIRDARDPGKAKRPVWTKWAAMAACLAVVIAIAIPLTKISQDKLPAEDRQLIEFHNAYYEVCDDKKVLKSLGIDGNITEEDAGELVTYLTAKTPGGKSSYIATDEETELILYSYAAAPCEAVYVICDNGNYDAVVFCNYVLPAAESISMEVLYATYGVTGAEDISSISVVNDWFEKKVVGVTITDAAVISDFYSASLSLQDCDNDTYHEIHYGHIGSEEELVKAYEKTSDNKITILFEAVNGLRFCLEYDKEGGWIYSGSTMRYYRVTDEVANWFSAHIS